MQWARLVPELLVRDLEASLAFWVGLLGFRIAYERRDEGFAYLDLDGAQVMLEQRSDTARQWVTGDMTPPLGRGLNLQIEVVALQPVEDRLAAADWRLFLEPEDAWYTMGDRQAGQRQLVVQDPDGYLVRLAEPLGNAPCDRAARGSGR